MKNQIHAYGRISNLKYESVHIDSKIVVFTRERNERRTGFEEHCTLPEVVSHEMWARDQKFLVHRDG